MQPMIPITTLNMTTTRTRLRRKSRIHENHHITSTHSLILKLLPQIIKSPRH